MSTSTFSPTFVAAMKRKVGLPILLLRLFAVLVMSPIRLVGHLLTWLGTLGEALVDWHDDWRHEVVAFTAPPIWTEITSLRDRCEKSEKDARLMRSICRDHDADLKRARELCLTEEAKRKGWDMPFPVIEWGECLYEPTQEPAQQDTPST